MFKINPKLVGKKFKYNGIEMEIRENDLHFKIGNIYKLYKYEYLQFIEVPGAYRYIGDYDYKGNSRDIAEIIAAHVGVKSLNEIFTDEYGIKYHYATLGQFIADNLTYVA